MMQGQLEISSTLAREAGVDELAEQREPFLEVIVMVYTVMVAMKTMLILVVVGLKRG